jgi:hypothetical protein
VIIIPERHACYIHVPRTGGMALQTAIEQVFPQAQRKAAGWEHVGAHAVRRILPSYDYHVFAIVRNPWDIFASYYGLLKRAVAEHPDWPPDYLEGLAREEPLSFRDLVQYLVQENSLATDGGFAARYCDADTIVFQYERDPWPEIAAWLNCELVLPRENESLCEPPTWDQGMIDLVKRYCRGDVERFGYGAPSARVTLNDGSHTVATAQNQDDEDQA